MPTSSKFPPFHKRQFTPQDTSKYAGITKHVKQVDLPKLYLFNDVIELAYGVSTVIPEDRSLRMYKYHNGLVIIDKAKNTTGDDNATTEVVGYMGIDTKRVYLLKTNAGMPYYHYKHQTSQRFENAKHTDISIRQSVLMGPLKDFVEDHFVLTYGERTKLIPERDFLNRNHRKLTNALKDELVDHFHLLSKLSAQRKR